MSLAQEEAIFNAARLLPTADERRQYLERACGDNPQLRQRVEALLRVLDDPISMFPRVERPTNSIGRDAIGVGQAIGPYRLVEVIGEGGMGMVYRAEQTEPVKRAVAVKVILPGRDSGQVLARFEAERQALSLMDHPNIARILDAGVVGDTRPYFVMELIHGVSITKYCDEHHLTPRQRLDLFIPVCRAVQHAHQKGIIHRDIKPSNVLVTQVDGRATPKVIDFGVAKAIGQRLTERTLDTNIGAIIGTLEYMSPEQAERTDDDIDTRSDVYSLGVLLYELLTGTTPLQKKQLQQGALFEALRIIREVEPPRPSTRLSTVDELPSIAANRGLEPRKLSSQIRGDLDWIVMKSLEKQRHRRYDTANGLGRDLERYLGAEPVEAGPPGAGYRLRKFVQRNRGSVIAASLLLLTLVAGIIGTSIGFYRADQGQKSAQAEKKQADHERERAERHYRRALEAVDRFMNRIGTVELAPVPHMDATRRRLLEDALEFYRGFLVDEGHDPQARRNVGRAHGRIAAIQENLGRLNEAEDASRQAIEIQRALLADFPNDLTYRLDLLITQRRLAQIWRWAGRISAAEQLLLEQLKQDSTVSYDIQAELAEHWYALGVIQRDARKQQDADSSLKVAVAMATELGNQAPENTDHPELKCRALNTLAQLCRETQRLDDAHKYFSASAEVAKRLIQAQPDNPQFQFMLTGILANHANIHSLHNRWSEAEAALRQALDLAERLVRDFPDRPEYPSHLAKIHNALGLHYSRRGDPVRGAAENDKALKIHEDLARRYPLMHEMAVNLAAGYGNKAKYLLEQEKWSEAATVYSQSIDALMPVVAASQQKSEAKLALYIAHLGRARAFRELKQFDQAAKDSRRTLELSEGERHPTYVNFRPRTLAHLGEYKQATAEAEAIVAAGNLLPSTVNDLAAVMAQCAGLARRDATLPEAERDRLFEQYGSRALALLRQAGEKGFFQRLAQITNLRTDERWQRLIDRDDFKKLTAEWETKLKPMTPNE